MSPPGTLVDNVDIHGDETVAVYNSVQCPVMTCVHIAETGGECSWSGSEYWRAETLSVTRPHSIIIVDGVRTEEASSVGRTKQFVCSIPYSTSCNK